MKSFWIDKDILIIKLSTYSSNVYIVNSRIIIDTGIKDDRKNLLKILEKNSINIDSIRIVINTHFHYDHIANNNIFKNAKIAMHVNDAHYAEIGDNEYACSYLFNKKLEKMKIDIKLRDRQKIYGMHVIHTPGHTEGSICIRYKKYLFTGDTIFAHGLGRTDLKGGNLKKLLRSIKTVSTLRFEHLLPGHGEIVMWNAKDVLKKLFEGEL